MHNVLQVYFINLLLGADPAVREDFVLENIEGLTRQTMRLTEEETERMVLEFQMSIIRLRNVSGTF